MTALAWQERFVGHKHGVAFDQPVRILTVTTAGVRCRFPDGQVDTLHPDDVRPCVERRKPQDVS